MWRRLASYKSASVSDTVVRGGALLFHFQETDFLSAPESRLKTLLDHKASSQNELSLAHKYTIKM